MEQTVNHAPAAAVPAMVDWPTDEGVWMANIALATGSAEPDWFPLQTMAMKDDLPSAEQMRLERESPATAPPRAVLLIVAQWPESELSWPYTFKGCHPVKQWRRPTDDELIKAKHFYQIKD